MKIKGLKNHSRLTIEGTPTDYYFFLNCNNNNEAASFLY